jgi:paraquat-inducible protein A
MNLKACHCCGLIHRLAIRRPEDRARCTRCGSVIHSGVASSSQARTTAAAIAALFLFPSAVALPILEIEKLGHHHQSSILGGTIELFQTGNWFVGGIILVFSIVFPLLKILALLELSCLGLLKKHHQAWTYRWMELLGKWSMMDVLLLGMLVMTIKLSGLVEFHFGPAVIAFALCVSMSMAAALCFDPHAIWEEE